MSVVEPYYSTIRPAASLIGVVAANRRKRASLSRSCFSLAPSAVVTRAWRASTYAAPYSAIRESERLKSATTTGASPTGESTWPTKRSGVSAAARR